MDLPVNRRKQGDGMLVLTRRPGESLMLELTVDSVANTALHAFFENGPIRIRVMSVQGAQVKIGIVVPRPVRILRAELVK